MGGVAVGAVDDLFGAYDAARCGDFVWVLVVRFGGVLDL